MEFIFSKNEMCAFIREVESALANFELGETSPKYPVLEKTKKAMDNYMEKSMSSFSPG